MGKKRGKRGKQKDKTKERNTKRELARPIDKQLERLQKAIQRKRNSNLALYPWLSTASSSDPVETPTGVTRVSLESESDWDSSVHALSDSSEAQETCREGITDNQSDKPPQG